MGIRDIIIHWLDCFRQLSRVNGKGKVDECLFIKQPLEPTNNLTKNPTNDPLIALLITLILWLQVYWREIVGGVKVHGRLRREQNLQTYTSVRFYPFEQFCRMYCCCRLKRQKGMAERISFFLNYLTLTVSPLFIHQKLSLKGGGCKGPTSMNSLPHCSIIK